MTGVLRALEAIGAKRIVIATPYLEEINRLEGNYVSSSGFDILDIAGMQIEKDGDMVCVAPDYIADFAASLDRGDADAVFISGEALRSLGIVDRLEQRLGKPVIVSNQAMIWDTLRLAGIDDRIGGHGMLLRKH